MEHTDRRGTARGSLLVDASALNAGLGAQGLVVVDTRGEGEYAKAHVPGALSFPVTRLSDPESDRSELLPVDAIADALGRAGIPDAGTLVLYDDSGLVPSARVFWALEHLGRSDMALLNGGFTAWRAAGYPVETGAPVASATRFTAAVVPERRAWKDDVLALMRRDGVRIVDARSADEYAGRSSTAAREGHIPTAVHVNWEQHIAGLLDPTFKPIDELRSLYADAGVTPDNRVITYCRSGARSSHSYFVLRMLGYEHVANYVDSWLEWGNDPDVPIE
ncbi:MAG: sulfurtransferase [Spirochaetaceae bacterium]|nr:MAG: sulfurtransferase [Spirochaetaceae bacterium]